MFTHNAFVVSNWSDGFNTMILFLLLLFMLRTRSMKNTVRSIEGRLIFKKVVGENIEMLSLDDVLFNAGIFSKMEAIKLPEEILGSTSEIVCMLSTSCNGK